MPSRHIMGRRVRGAVLGTLFAALVVFASPAFWTLSGGEPEGEWVLVTRVVDGDTIRVGRGWRETTVRLVGVDAPETVHPDRPVEAFGPEASSFTRRRLDGRRVRLEIKPDERLDKYGRLLAYVFLPDGALFNREIIAAGYARAYTRFPFNHAADFLAVEAEARRAQRGLWSEVREPEGRIIGNRRSMIYHLPGQMHYDEVAERNRVYFDSEDAAVHAGYRRARR